MSEAPKGILRNKRDSNPNIIAPDQLDRQEVIKNTQLNAQLAQQYSSEGDKIRALLAEKKKHDHDGEEGEGGEHTKEGGDDQNHDHLKWDELNLYQTEQEKSATMKIDEPKTPYEGGFNPDGEYYRDDPEDGLNGTDQIPDFELGESEFDNSKDKSKIESLHGGEVIKDPEYDGDEDNDDEEEEEEVSAEERHKRFEEMRKAHYHMKGEVLHHKVDLDE
ncbi:hypothetical protein DFJ63DRAFT_62016 [Scheffersomyces coipomensis]|uniref:uncharacterized protein n=1 Tax=Scheffersomyces coipomensis TaxID=1788519 RepID=UPI00315CB39C